jgi:xylan 1,4-beta-xylosidase
MGSPKTLTAQQVAALNAQTVDRAQDSVVRVGKSGVASVKVTMRANDVVLVKISPK